MFPSHSHTVRDSLFLPSQITQISKDFFCNLCKILKARDFSQFIIIIFIFTKPVFKTTGRHTNIFAVQKKLTIHTFYIYINFMVACEKVN